MSDKAIAKRGGKREGAGRPAGKKSPSTSHSVRLKDESWKLRDKTAAKLGDSKRVVMEAAIEEYAAKHGISPDSP